MSAILQLHLRAFTHMMQVLILPIEANRMYIAENNTQLKNITGYGASKITPLTQFACLRQRKISILIEILTTGAAAYPAHSKPTPFTSDSSTESSS
jgi:hypothetical protein